MIQLKYKNMIHGWPDKSLRKLVMPDMFRPYGTLDSRGIIYSTNIKFLTGISSQGQHIYFPDTREKDK
jgi:hypothetical protein